MAKVIKTTEDLQEVTFLELPDYVILGDLLNHIGIVMGWRFKKVTGQLFNGYWVDDATGNTYELK